MLEGVAHSRMLFVVVVYSIYLPTTGRWVSFSSLFRNNLVINIDKISIGDVSKRHAAKCLAKRVLYVLVYEGCPKIS